MEQNWNWHVQNTDIVQGYPGFSAKYSGPNSLPNGGETRETVSLDLMAGVRLWRGAEAHVDGLMWQGFGVDNTLGVEAFPSAEAYRAGTTVPNGMFARLFIRQTIGLGGDEETVDDDQLHLAGEQDMSRLTFTLGRMSVIDIFDNNTYANDPRTQFMNWALVSNEAWDYPADAVGYTTGVAVELNQPRWALRYGFFQMPGLQNSFTADDQIFKWPAENSIKDGKFWQSWGMPVELEYRYQIKNHPGKIRFLAYLNEAHMASYAAAIAILQANGPGADTTPARAYRFKYGFGLNWEQEITQNIGVFSRLGWSDGRTESWVFADVDRTASLGVSIKGGPWDRPDDTFGLAGVINAITSIHQQFFADGGLGILGGDGALNYGWEKTLETYYDFKIWKTVHAALDYQFVTDPAFNRDRGPVSFFGARLHWEF
ncbi:MAG TPA: carbohydrate porin [Candidatus Nitrosopolaris sp.]|nr:carbohydrate porin [Candidatus Nitrosopolaris sp.]